VGDRKHNLDTALDFIGHRLKIESVSSVYDTAPEDNTDQPHFLNMVILAHTTLEPLHLLTLLKGIEAKLGRPPANRYSPRIIDIDILFYGQHTFNASELTIPHPRIQERSFVLIPLAEIAPELSHPLSGKSVTQMLADLKKGVQGIFKFIEVSVDKG